MSQSQLNVRMDDTLRMRGNLALESAGFTPSQAVRALWSFAASHCDSPKEIIAFFDSIGEKESAEVLDARKKKNAAVHEGASMVSNFYKKLGITPDDSCNKPYSELRDEALIARLEERGMMN